MANDGENIYLLKPRKDRKKYTKAELEEMLFQEVLCRIENFLYGVDISQNPAWSLAVENDIKLKDHKYYSDPKNMDLEALMEFIKVSEKKSSVFALSNLHKYGQEALKAHPEAVVALLETLARYPNTSLYEYKEVVKSTKKLLKKEFNTDEKLNELFLRSKKAKKL